MGDAFSEGLFGAAEDKKFREGPSGKPPLARFDSKAQRGRRAAPNSAREANMANARLGRIGPAFRRSTGDLDVWDRVIGLRAGKILEEFKHAATNAGLAPITAKEVDHRQARRRKMFGKSIIRPQQETREFGDAWIMPDDQQGFHLAGGLGKNLQQGFGVGIIKCVANFAGRRLSWQFAKDRIERIARAQRR